MAAPTARRAGCVRRGGADAELRERGTTAGGNEGRDLGGGTG
jgi:hypothetical protein